MINKKKIIAMACSFALIAGIAAPALAANTPSKASVLPAATDNRHHNLTEEQKNEFRAKREEKRANRKSQEEKWSKLTDAQKNEIYSLRDQIADLQMKTADKYAEFGVITKEEATTKKERITARKARMRDGGRMPGSRIYDDGKHDGMNDGNDDSRRGWFHWFRNR